MPASHSNKPLTYTSRHPASWALLTRSDTLLGLPDHILHGLLSGSSDACLEGLRSRRPIVPAVQNVWTTLLDLTSALVSGQTINGMQSTVRILPGSISLYSGPVPVLLAWVCPEYLGLSSTICGLVLGDSICPCTNWVLRLHQIESEQTTDHVYRVSMN